GGQEPPARPARPLGRRRQRPRGLCPHPPGRPRRPAPLAPPRRRLRPDRRPPAALRRHAALLPRPRRPHRGGRRRGALRLVVPRARLPALARRARPPGRQPPRLRGALLLLPLPPPRPPRPRGPPPPPPP